MSAVEVLPRYQGEGLVFVFALEAMKKARERYPQINHLAMARYERSESNRKSTRASTLFDRLARNPNVATRTGQWFGEHLTWYYVPFNEAERICSKIAS